MQEEFKIIPAGSRIIITDKFIQHKSLMGRNDWSVARSSITGLQVQHHILSTKSDIQIATLGGQYKFKMRSREQATRLMELLQN